MKRLEYLKQIDKLFKVFKAVALLGPRQCGKTTLARMKCDALKNFDWDLNYFDLENPQALSRLQDPKLALQDLKGLVVIDEIQRRPELFPVLRYLLDRRDNPIKLLVLGSASRDLIQQSSESLAGRIAFLEVAPFHLGEIKNIKHWKNLWVRGGFPLSYLAKTDEQSFVWLNEYIRSYLERDIPALGITIPSDTIRRFWLMLTHNHANLLNSSELARSFGVADTTIRRYLEILTSTFMIRQLKPHFTNTHKRQVKAPKIYFRDSGVLHALMGISNYRQVLNHIKLGASWEGFALEQVINLLKAPPESCAFWAVHAQAEMDLILPYKGKWRGFEFKYTDRPKITPSIKIALELLNLERVDIITPEATSFQLSEKVFVSSLQSFVK